MLVTTNFFTSILSEILLDIYTEQWFNDTRFEEVLGG
jgi:hypothetical protein